MAGLKKISLYEVIGNFAGNTGINNVNDMLDDIARWSVEAEMHIASRRSYERLECEIEVKDYRACLPKNFVYLNGIKHGNEILEVTKKDFRLFNKGGSSFFNAEQTSNLLNGNLVLDVPGCALVMQLNFTGPFAENDIITITIVANNCGTMQNNTFNYVVTAIDTINTIVQNISNQINAIGSLPYAVVYGATFIQITGNSPEISFVISPFTNSVQGTIECVVYQQRVATKKRSTETNGSNNQIRTTSPNLANRDAAALNTGLTSDRTHFSGSGYGGFGYYGDFGSASKFSIENGWVYFNQIKNDRVGISYMGIPLDENGWPLIEQAHADAISAYLTYMYLKRRFIMGKVSGQVYNEMKNEWHWKCGQARGEDELPDATELQYLANQHMQLMPLPNNNFF